MKTTIRLLALFVLVLVSFAPHIAVSAGDLEKGHRFVSRNDGFNVEVDSADATYVRLKWQPIQGGSEYEVSRDGSFIGSTIATVGYFTDFDVRPKHNYQYAVTARDASGAILAQSKPVGARTTSSATIRTHYTILAIAFNPERASLVTEETYLRHRIQFLELASLGSATIDLYQGRLISSTATPMAEPGSNMADYVDLVTRRDIPELDGASIVDLVEQGAVDHVWVAKSPVDFWENVLIGNRLIQGEGLITANSWPPLAVKCSRSFFVNGYSPDERSYDAYAHMVEGVMTSISDGHPELWPRNLFYTVYTHDFSSMATTPAWLNQWEQFRLTDGWNGGSPVAYASEGNGNIGSSHFPPNTPRDCADYCYFDLATWQRYIDSVADDWLRFPSFSGSKRKLNGYDFGAFNYYAEGDASYAAAFGASPELHSSFEFAAASYHQWWFAHLPHNPGVTDGRLNSWWPYLFDFNRFDGARIYFKVDGFRAIPARFRPSQGEYGTNARTAEDWGYWHSDNGFSPGAKATELDMVSRAAGAEVVKSGKVALKVFVENAQYWEGWGVGRNDVFYPASRNAHWDFQDLREVRVSIKLGDNPHLIVGTNPIVRLYKNGGNRIELVPRVDGRYANLLQDTSLRDGQGWYTFHIPIVGDATWEKNVIGYIDPLLPEAEVQAAKAQLERDILADLNYVEVSIRSTTSQSDAPYDVVTFYIDGLELVDR
ncbi:MAG TPA: hypothetical protein VGK56_02120 [Anaerolineales bacterium]